MFFKKRIKKEENKWLEEIKGIPDEDFLANKNKLLLKYGLFSGGSFILALIGIFLFIVAISG